MGTETIRFTQLGEQDLRFGTGTFEITLADGRKVVLDEIDLGTILSDATKSTRTVTLDSLTVTTLSITTLTVTGVLTASGTLRIPEKADPTTMLSGEVWINSGGVVLEYADDASTVAKHTLVAEDTTQTLTNKTLTAPTITTPTMTGGSWTGGTDLAVADGGTGVSSFTDKALIVGNGSSALETVTVGADGSIPFAQSSLSTGHRFAAALNKYIYGFTYANNASDATNDLDIAAGGAMDATGAYFMVGSALTKQSDAAWAVGTNAGGLDTGAVGNSDYYIWVIARSDTGVVDYLFSLSSTAPTMPASYDYKRLIGWFKRTGGTIVAFTTYETEGGGLEYAWNVPTLDVSLANTLTTARRTDALRVPLNFSVVATVSINITDAGNPANIVCCPDVTDTAPAGDAATSNITTAAAGATWMGMLKVRTSATGTIAARSNTATVDTYQVSTYSFFWARRN